MEVFDGNKRYRAQAVGGTALSIKATGTGKMRVRRGIGYVLSTDLKSAVNFLHMASGGSEANADDVPFSYEKDLEFVADTDTINIFNPAATTQRVWLREEWPAAGLDGAGRNNDVDDVEE